MIYNHDRPLSDFDEPLALIREAGFNPIGVTFFMFEDVFIFETKEEATQAYHVLEQAYPIDGESRWIGEVVGWWYGKKKIKKMMQEYSSINDHKKAILVYWLDSEGKDAKIN
jgi:hypothetical protein